MTTALALVLALVLPGIAGGVLLTRRSDTGYSGILLLRTLSVGIAVWLVSSGVLARVGAMSATPSWTTAVVLGAVSVGVLALRRSRTILRGALADFGFLALALLVAAVSWLPIAQLVLRTTWGPLGSTPWYYWSLAAKVAASGHMPSTTTEWGVTLPFLDDYHLFTTATAMLFTQGGHPQVPALQTVVMLSVGVLACGAALLTRMWGTSPAAALLAVPVAVATGIGAPRLTSYRPEAFGLGLTVLVVAGFADWFRRGERGSLVAAAALAGALAQVHGIAFMSALVLSTAAAVSLGWGRPWRSCLRRCVMAAVSVAVSVLVLAAALGGSTSTEHVGGLANQGGLADQTWQFVRAIRGTPPSRPPSNLELLINAYRNTYRPGSSWVLWLLFLAIGVLVIVALRARVGKELSNADGLRQEDAARLGARALRFIAVSALGMAALSAVFALGWSGYVPRRTGVQRFTQEATLLVGPIMAWAAAVLAGFLRPPRRTAFLVAGVALLTVAGTLCSLSLLPHADQRPAPEAVHNLHSLDLSRDAVVLSNGYTEGYLSLVTGGQGLLEGRAPYTFPQVLSRANRLLRGAAAFYRAPASHRSFLERHRVDFVVVARPGTYATGTPNLFDARVPRRKFNRCPWLTAVLLAPDVAVYQVHRGA